MSGGAPRRRGPSRAGSASPAWQTERRRGAPQRPRIARQTRGWTGKKGTRPRSFRSTGAGGGGRRQPTLPQRGRCSTIGALRLNFRVRDGNGWDPQAIVTGQNLGRLLGDGEGRGARVGGGGTFRGQAVRTISTGQLRALLRFHTRPINLVVFEGPSGRAHLEEGFPLRCFQRLSRPHVATRHCDWRHNRQTRGASIPVLSY